MKIYKAIEDLDIQFLQQYNKNNYPSKTQQCFLRNYQLIKKYTQQYDYLALARFKKRVIPQHIEKIHQNIKLNEYKYRKMFYERRRIFNKQFIKKVQICSSSQLNISSQGNYPVRQIEQKKQRDPKNLQSPKDKDPYFNESKLNLKTYYGRQKYQPKLERLSLNLKISSIFEQDKQQQKNSEDLQPKKQLYSSSNNLCTNLQKKYFFQTSISQILKIKKKRKSNQFLSNLDQINQSYQDQRTLETKMLNIFKLKKWKKKHDKNMASNIFHIKKMSQGWEEKQNDNTSSKQRNLSQTSNKFYQSKASDLNLGLKGHICLPLKHRISNSCNLAYLDYPLKQQNLLLSVNSSPGQQNFIRPLKSTQVIKQKKNILENSRNSYRQTNNKYSLTNSSFPSKKFLLPKFS